MLHKRCYISSVLAFSCGRAKTIRIRYVSPRSRHLEVVGERQKGRARETRSSPSRAPFFSCAHYFQAPATQANASVHAYFFENGEKILRFQRRKEGFEEV